LLLGLPGFGCLGQREDLSVAEVDDSLRWDSATTEWRAAVIQCRAAHEGVIEHDVEESRLRGAGHADDCTAHGNGHPAGVEHVHDTVTNGETLAGGTLNSVRRLQ
jgi:hypothetical protein